MKLRMAGLAVVVLVSSAFARTHETRAWHETRRLVVNSEAVSRELAVMMQVSRDFNTEQLRCVTEFGIKGDTVMLKRLGPGEMAGSDSNHVWLYPTVVGDSLELRVCGDMFPTLHTHLALDGGGPYGASDADRIAWSRSKAPFHFVLADSPSGDVYLAVYER